MLDIRMIRDDPDMVKAGLILRGVDYPAMIDELLDCDRLRREAETRQQELNAERKALSKRIGAAKGRGEDTSEIEARVKAFGGELAELAERVGELGARQRDLLLNIPNLPHDECPRGEDEASNPELRTWGEKPEVPGGARDHLEIGGALGLFDSERAAKISGSGFFVFTGQGARLERALIQFLLDLHTREHGYTEVSPPFLVRRDSMVGTGQLPKFEDDMYGVEDGALFLAPTAEVPVTNLLREEILDGEELPKRFVAYTPCFRREAGSAGKETRGLIRLHQFDKVELVQVVRPRDSFDVLESLTGHAEKALQLLGLHYRVIELCTGDLGFSALRTYDIEVWAPGQNQYLEVSSCSNFGDYQARRMNLRFKDEESGKNTFCHTLNGSGTALPRLFVALIESGLQSDGSVLLPEPLHGYFGGDRLQTEAASSNASPVARGGSGPGDGDFIQGARPF